MPLCRLGFQGFCAFGFALVCLEFLSCIYNLVSKKYPESIQSSFRLAFVFKPPENAVSVFGHVC